jgi:hypothetical protein
MNLKQIQKDIEEQYREWKNIKELREEEYYQIEIQTIYTDDELNEFIEYDESEDNILIDMVSWPDGTELENLDISAEDGKIIIVVEWSGNPLPVYDPDYPYRR